MNIFECSPRDYHQKLKCNRANILAPDSYLSKSVLWELDSSSLYKWRYYTKPRETTAAMRWGSLIDCLTTTPELEGSDIALSPFDSFRTKEAQAWKAAQEAEKKTIVTAEDLEEARAAVKMLTQTCKASAEIFAKSKSQVIVAGNVLGVKVKGLIDLAPQGENFLADLKTVSTFSLEGFAKQVANFGYHMQAGIYLNLWNAMFPNDQRTGWKFIWQDSAAPYEACVTELAPQDIEAGWLYASTLIKRLLDATAADCWPMAFEQETITTRPTWAAMQEESKQTPTTEQP
jgi:hypothetical protein